jgi:Flp pilus assembly protein TadG
MNQPAAIQLSAVPARRRRYWGWRNSELGQSLVEFSLILPLMLVMLFALVDFGRGFYTWLVVTNAAREGARAAAVQSDNSTIDSKIYASFCNPYPSNCSLDPTKMTITKTNVQGARGSEATVDISYTFVFVTPVGSILQLIGGSNLAAPAISSHSAMRLE